jgi:hypothetical protein
MPHIDKVVLLCEFVRVCRDVLVYDILEDRIDISSPSSAVSVLLVSTSLLESPFFNKVVGSTRDEPFWVCVLEWVMGFRLIIVMCRLRRSPRELGC